MKEAEKRRQNLRNVNIHSALVRVKDLGGTDGKCETSLPAVGGGTGNSDRKTNRTTRMLLVVVALFLVTEFPQGIINLLSGVLSGQFVEQVYMPLGDLLDIIALVNNGINFLLYCTMSKQFRDTFVQVVFSSCHSSKCATSRTGQTPLPITAV